MFVLSVRLSAGNDVDCGRTADLVEMPFGVVGRVGPRYTMHLDGRLKIPPTGRDIFGEIGMRSVKYMKNVALC